MEKEKKLELVEVSKDSDGFLDLTYHRAFCTATDRREWMTYILLYMGEPTIFIVHVESFLRPSEHRKRFLGKVRGAVYTTEGYDGPRVLRMNLRVCLPPSDAPAHQKPRSR
jgi:hypothetical protein